jgi:superfamily I DNA/RNA helicase
MYRSALAMIREAVRKASLRLAANSDESPSIEPGYFADLLVFFLALDAYQKIKGQDDPHVAEAIKLLRRYQGDLVEGINKFIVPLLGNSVYARYRSSVAIAARPTRGLEQALEQADILGDILSYLRTRANDLEVVFADNRALAAARKIAMLMNDPSPQAVLSGLVTVPPASRLRMTREWVREAASLANVSPATVELVMADAQAAKNLGDDLRVVNSQLDKSDPTSVDSVALQEKKQDLLDQIETVANTSAAPSVVLAAAVSAVSQDKGYATKIGKVQRLSPDQERAMMVRGKGIIAAGAGSGKTKTLASKVVYHIDELGVPPRSIMATSFSRKSAAELRKRIEDYGAVFGNGEDTGLGTTHSIAAKLMREYGSGLRDGLKNYEQTNLVRLAMKQVEMAGKGTANPPPPTSLFPSFSAGAAPSPSAVSPSPTLAPVQGPSGMGLTFAQAVEQAYGARGRFPNNGYGDFARGMITDFYNKTQRGSVDPRRLSDKQKSALGQIFNMARVSYNPNVDPNLVPSGRTAAKKSKDKDKGLREKYPAFSQPANQWFNMGLFLTDDGTSGGEPLPPGHFKQAITKFKGRVISPSEAYHLAKSGQLPDKMGLPEAAVYAAYEYLKGPNGEQDFSGKGDFDDVLIDVSKMLLANPRALSSAQARFKVILVDEAQDLNRCVSGDTEVQTPNGPVAIRDVEVGTQVLSYENGEVVYNQVLNKTRSSWARGYRIHLTSGDTLLMSPDHRIYATPVTCEDGQMALYLMYRKDMGFRIGTTRDLSKRAPQEHADCAWVLEIGEDAEMLYKEQAFSLKYGVPTYIFEGAVRGCDQPRIDRLFQEFGENGRGILAEYDLHFEYPHWVASAVDRGRFTRRVVNFCPHRSKGKNSQKGSSVSMNWTAGDFDFGADVPTYTIKGGRKMVGILTSDYAKGRSIAQAVAEKSGAYLVESLLLGDESLPLITASGLFPGMRIPVWVGGVSTRNEDLLGVDAYRALAQEYGVLMDDLAERNVMGKRLVHERIRHAQVLAGCAEPLPAIEDGVVQTVEIESVEVVSEGDFWDIAVENAHNFFGNRILSHNCQHMMFGLLAGFIDPAKADRVATVQKIGELAKDDGSMTADTYCFIGDDKQCVAADSLVDTPNGPVFARDLKAGDAVLSYRNGRVTSQTVKHAFPTAWEWGFKVTTESGHTLTMSPNHRLWATEPQTNEDEVLVHLMYRSDMGFRVGITNKGKVGSEGDYLNSYGGRAFLEKAERMWVLEVCPDRESALLAEARYMLQYGVPDTVFNGEHRGLNQERVEALFKEFGQNGAKVLEAKNYGFKYPHWASQSYTKHGRERHVVTLLAHASTGTQVSMEWEGPKFDIVTAGMGVKHAPNDRRRLRRYFSNYREALAFAEQVAEVTGAMLSHKLSTDEGSLREITAAGLFVGMSVPVVTENGVVLDPIADIERVENSFIDLDVDDASNFFAGGILTHNSIYEFRGADPEAFIDMSDLIEGGAGFKTEILKTNYRSGKLIVEAANRLIAYNKKQIPMTCDANPTRSDVGGISRVPFPPQDPKDMSAPAMWLAERIEEMMELGEGGKKGYDGFGVGLRSNSEAYTYGIELLKKGIPFRSKANFFNDQNTKALLNWLTIADEGVDGDVNRINDAVLNARTAPTSMLGQKFVDELTQKAVGNYLVWLQQNYASIYGPRAFQTTSVKGYVDNLTTVANLKNSGLSNEMVLDAILNLQGSDGTTVMDALVDKIRSDDEIMAELRAADPSGEITDEAVLERATAPIAPLKGLLDARANLTEAMKYVRTLQVANAKLTADDDPEAKGFREPAVTLGTMHSWKGLEVANMFVPVVGGRFPRTDATEEDLASERRLAYVALTRGENKVFVMDIPTTRQTKSGVTVLESQFIGEMCLPSSMPTKTANLHTARYSVTDPALLDAFVQGEEAFERAVAGGNELTPLWDDLLYTGE